MRILVLGAGGMAGHVIATHLQECGHDVKTLSATKKLDDTTVLIDVTDKQRLTDYLAENSFDVVVNCIGILIHLSNSRPDLATYLNSYLPHFLEHFYKESLTKVIHLSTDCVFSGKNAPYTEESVYDGEIFYDRSKALGEIINMKDLTFRMSIIGPDMQKNGVGLFNWFYAQTGEIGGYINAIWSGITTIELAKGISAAIDQNLCGLYHLVPETNISKYDLLELFIKSFGRSDISLRSDDTVSLDKTLLNTRDDFNYNVPDYETMITQMQEWIKDRGGLYEHYQA